MANGAADQATALDQDRIKLTFQIAVVGIVAVVVVVGVAIGVFHGAKNPGELIPAVVGSVTGAIGTLAGLVAGHAAGAAGKAQAEQRAAASGQEAAAGRALAHTLLADAPAGVGERVLGAQAFAVEPNLGADVAARHAALARRLFPDLNGS